MKKAMKYLTAALCIFALTIIIWLNVLMHVSSTDTGEVKDYYHLLDDRTKSMNMKYILQWTSPYTEPFVFMGRGRDTFVKNQCFYNNCYVTSNKQFFPSLTDFHAVLFHGPELHRDKNNKITLPDTRATHQKYVFASMESSDYYPMCTNRYDNFFNWTWTYKLNSDIYFGYIIIRNDQGEIIGPDDEVWMQVEEMRPINDKLKEQLDRKTTAAAWFVSNCDAPSKRLDFAKNLQVELKTKHNLTLDIYGLCGKMKCPKKNGDCLRMIDDKYYFYLSFENSFSQDYVTEKLLNALQHYAVPVVFGGANYSRFMPDGIYLDGRRLGVEKLASTMASLIGDKNKYYEFFKWHNHYSYHQVESTPETDYYCQLCSKLNRADYYETTTYSDFRRWWNPPKIRANVCSKK